MFSGHCRFAGPRVVSIDQIKEDERRDIKRDREGVSAEPIRELRIVLEFRAKSRLVQNWEFEAKVGTNNYFFKMTKKW